METDLPKVRLSLLLGCVRHKIRARLKQKLARLFLGLRLLNRR
jgi:hypothetical protein